VWRMMEKVLVSAVADATDVTARRGAWRSHGRTQRMEGSGNRRLSPMSKRCGSRDECMAGVWGEASPQAPPEGAGGARRKARHDVRGRAATRRPSGDGRSAPADVGTGEAPALPGLLRAYE